MEESSALLVDVISILPEGAELYIQAPNIEDEIFQKLLVDTEFPYYRKIRLEGSKKQNFLDRISSLDLVDQFHSVEIRNGSKLLFEGWDGVEFGNISKTIFLPEWFISKWMYSEMLWVSENW